MDESLLVDLTVPEHKIEQAPGSLQTLRIRVPRHRPVQLRQQGLAAVSNQCNSTIGHPGIIVKASVALVKFKLARAPVSPPRVAPMKLACGDDGWEQGYLTAEE